MGTGDFSTHHIPHISPDIRGAKLPAHLSQLAHLAIRQELNSLEKEEWSEPEIFFPPNMARRFETIENKVRKRDSEKEASKAEAEEETKVAEIRRIEGISERFQKLNYELQSRLLLLLRGRLKSSDSKEDLLKKVLESYPDYSNADEALDFLIESSEGELKRKLIAVKKDFNDRFGQDIRAGRNMGAQARLFSEQGLGSATALRDMYRDLIGNPREPPVLFEELSKVSIQ